MADPRDTARTPSRPRPAAVGDPSPEAIAVANIRRIRQARRLSVQALVDQVNAIQHDRTLYRANFAAVEAGRRRLGINELVAIAAVLGVAPGQLLTTQHCDRCFGAPPVGFTCNDCGQEGT